MRSSPHKQALQPKQELLVSQVYCAAINIFAEAGMKPYAIIGHPNDNFPVELARVYKRGNDYFILYYPGKDNDKSMTGGNTTRPLHEIVNLANSAIARHYPEVNEAHPTKYYIIGQSNKSFLIF